MIVTTRLIYIDDSGSYQTKIAVYGWVELPVTSWRAALRGWLNWRQALYDSVGIPVSYELHATKFVNGRGRPTGTPWDEVKSHRGPVVAEALRTIVGLPGVRTGAVFRQAAPGHKHRESMADTYASLVRELDGRLTAAGEFGMIVMDGDGTDPSYRSAHRELKLATRSLIEDPLFQGSHLSQLVMMADLVAYTAYMHLVRIPTKEQTWNWYREIVGAAAVTGAEPRELKGPSERS